MNLPSIKTIQGLGFVDLRQAKSIRACMERYENGGYYSGSHESFDIQDCLIDINKIMDGYGVEGSIEPDQDTAKWDIQYVNMGDTYTPTIIYVSDGNPARLTEGFKVMCWGNLFE